MEIWEEEDALEDSPVGEEVSVRKKPSMLAWRRCSEVWKACWVRLTHFLTDVLGKRIVERNEARQAKRVG